MNTFKHTQPASSARINISLNLMMGLVSVFTLAGCSTPLTANNYSRSDVRIVQEVDYGTILNVRPVSIDGTNSGQGSATGALIGGIGGSNFGTGNMNVLSTAGGALIGSVAGVGLEEHVTRARGVELVIELKSGRRVALVQEDSKPAFFVGQKVRIMGIAGSARVTPDEGM